MKTPVRRTLTERRSDELRMSVALAARDLFVLDGGTGPTVDDICRQAGISQRTFYRHFAVKEDVVVPLFERAAELIAEALEATPEGGDVITDLARAFCWGVFEESAPGEPWSGFLSVLMDSSEYRLRWHAIDEPLTEPVAAFLRRRGLGGDGQFEGTLQAGLILQGVRLAYHYWIRTDASQDLDKLLEQALTTVVSAWEGIDQPR
ncbi:TetR/AcrR family transcriptional regulator [Actinomadura sp. WMMA1423]|uniref:TetR/AcrR family transcriptional regulator n=1 Tax=Actinomadura sp. WMMA1423 TaxID=2591108 RepID=UPI00114700BC|nr:TetR/AcrR family transcriptional regulator [Actinomadura sp. WMMA1423]